MKKSLMHARQHMLNLFFFGVVIASITPSVHLVIFSCSPRCHNVQKMWDDTARFLSFMRSMSSKLAYTKIRVTVTWVGFRWVVREESRHFNHRAAPLVTSPQSRRKQTIVHHDSWWSTRARPSQKSSQINAKEKANIQGNEWPKSHRVLAGQLCHV